jgi:hypothetical protein
MEAFSKNNRKSCLRSDMGRNKVCIACNIERAKESMSCLEFNYKTGKFDKLIFANEQQIYEHFKTKQDEQVPHLLPTEGGIMLGDKRTSPKLHGCAKDIREE